MLNCYFMTMGPGSSPDPNIYYRTQKEKDIRMDVLFFLALRARFEDLNADVRWTSAWRQLDGGNSINFFPKERNCNKSGRYCSDGGYFNYTPTDTYLYCVTKSKARPDATAWLLIIMALPSQRHSPGGWRIRHPLFPRTVQNSLLLYLC